MKHTSGPWQIAGSAVRAHDVDFHSPENNPKFEEHGFCICILPNGGSEARRRKIKANAKLICAAPELLCALDNIARELREKNEIVPRYIIDAINKARIEK